MLYLPAGKRASRHEQKFFDAIFLGILDRSDELIVGTPAGVFKARSVKCLSNRDRIAPEYFNSIRGLPWQPVPGEPAYDIPVSLHVSAPSIAPEINLPRPLEPPPDPKARRVYIRKNIELLKYGYTANCPGCNAARANRDPA